MSKIVERLRSEYSGKDVGVDTLIDRYELLEADTVNWRQRMENDGLITRLDNGFMIGHPLLKHLIGLERLLHVTLRELMFATRLIDLRKSEVDDVDTFLEQMQQGTKPHFGRIHGQ